VELPEIELRLFLETVPEIVGADLEGAAGARFLRISLNPLSRRPALALYLPQFLTAHQTRIVMDSGLGFR
jgi:hypothetical protein